MEATAILAPHERTIRGRLKYFLRLRLIRQMYEETRPSEKTASERARFDLAQLELCWDRVTEFQRVIGLEAAHFTPREQFEMIFIASAFADRDLASADNTMLDLGGSWQAYCANLQKLSYDLNPFEFGEVCLRCYGAIQELTGSASAQNYVISLEATELARLNNVSGEPLRMLRRDHFSRSGLSRYLPDGRSS